MPEPAGGRDDPGAGRVLGLDLGDVRIGVAISDPDRRIAVPLGTVHVGRPPAELKAIAALVSSNDVACVVVGYPLSLSGEVGPRARLTEELAGTLRSILEVPVVLHDERLSTHEAERELRRSGVPGRVRRRLVDRSAAVVILQAYLDSHRR